MQFSLQALPFSRHAQNDGLFGQLSPVADAFGGLPQRACVARQRLDSPALLCVNGSIASRPPLRQPTLISSPQARVRILRNETSNQGGRLLISGRMADVCAALNRLAFNEYACG
jgi:hypothetical protein